MHVAGIPALGTLVAAFALTLTCTGGSVAAAESSSPALPGTAPGAAAPRNTAGEAQPKAKNCWWDGSRRHWYCNTRAHAPLYDGNRIVGYLETTTSWIKCRRDGGRNHGGTHPTRWELTRADTPASHPWGWVSDNDIRSETNSLPTC